MEKNIGLADDYYKGFIDRDLTRISSHLHPDVHFIAPMGELKGRDAVVEAAKRLVNIMKGLIIRARFSSGDQVVLVYDIQYGDPIGICRTAVMMNFKDGLIIRTELFYDARPFGNL